MMLKLLGTVIGLVLVLIPEPATTAAGIMIIIYLWTGKKA
jgi:hypothetical protein